MGLQAIWQETHSDGLPWDRELFDYVCNALLQSLPKNGQSEPALNEFLKQFKQVLHMCQAYAVNHNVFEIQTFNRQKVEALAGLIDSFGSQVNPRVLEIMIHYLSELIRASPYGVKRNIKPLSSFCSIL